MGKIDLYWTILSPPCRAIRMTAEAIGLQLDLKEIDVLVGESKSEEFTKLNPQQQVPVIVDNGLVLAESRAIMEYLVDKYAKNDSLYPKDAGKRALVNSRLYFDCGTLCPKVYKAFNGLFWGEAAKEEDVLALKDSVKVIEEFLKRSKWIAGPEPTIADISLVAIMSGLPIYGFDLSPYPHITNWVQECKKNIPGYHINEEGDAQTIVLLEKLSKKA